MFAKELQRCLYGMGVDVFGVNPGVVNTPGIDKIDARHYWTGLALKLQGKAIGQSQQHGAMSLIYAAMAPELKGDTGGQLPEIHVQSFLSIAQHL